MKSREPKLQTNTLKNILQKNTYYYGMNELNGEQEREGRIHVLFTE